MGSRGLHPGAVQEHDAHAPTDGRQRIRGPNRAAACFRALVPTCAAFALSVGAAHAADVLAAAPAPEPAPVLPGLSGWYVRVGAMGTLTQSTSNLFSQSMGSLNVPGVGFVPAGVGPETQIPGRGATYSNFFSADFQGGYSFTPNWSVEVATGFPMWSTVRINGYSPDGPPSGTVLGRVMPGRRTDNRRLSFHPIRQVPALPGGRDFADLRLGGPGRLCHRDFVPIVACSDLAGRI